MTPRAETNHPSRWLRADRGSVTVWLATSSFIMIVLVGLAVDLAGQVRSQQRVRNVAAQAARAGGQELNGPRAIRGLSVKANPVKAARTSQAYLSTAGVSGTAVAKGDTVTVSASDTYSTKFLSVIGLKRMRVTGRAEVRIVRVSGGVER